MDHEREPLRVTVDEWLNGDESHRPRLTKMATDLFKRKGVDGVIRLRAEPVEAGRRTNDKILSEMPPEKLRDLWRDAPHKGETITQPIKGALKPADFTIDVLGIAFEWVTNPIVYLLHIPAIGVEYVRKWATYAKKYLAHYIPDGLPLLDHIVFIGLGLQGLWDAWTRRHVDSPKFGPANQPKPKPEEKSEDRDGVPSGE